MEINSIRVWRYRSIYKFTGNYLDYLCIVEKPASAVLPIFKPLGVIMQRVFKHVCVMEKWGIVYSELRICIYLSKIPIE